MVRRATFGSSEPFSNCIEFTFTQSESWDGYAVFDVTGELLFWEDMPVTVDGGGKISLEIVFGEDGFSNVLNSLSASVRLYRYNHKDKPYVAPKGNWKKEGF